MVALNGIHPYFYRKLHTFIGTGIVADDVSQIQDLVRLMLYITKYRLKRLNIGMDIRENRYLHDVSLQSARNRTSNALPGSIY
jgi:hypothetical protein